jgi:hypothetical protein
MTSYEAKFDDIARGNSVSLTEFARAGDYSQVAEIAEVADQKGDIDIGRQKIRLPQEYVESKLNTGVGDVLSGAATVLEAAADAVTLNYPGRKAREADRTVDRLDARNDEDDFRQIRSLLSSSETKRVAADAGVLGGFAAAAAGYRLDSLVAVGAGLATGYGCAGLAAAESRKNGVYAQEAGKGWEKSYGHLDVELV